MSKTILNDVESVVLARAVRHFVVRRRTGELGIMHGADRFVSTNDRLRRDDLTRLETALKKLGVSLGQFNR